MRIRPFFWLLLAASCISVLIFAAIIHVHVPGIMHVHLAQQHPAAHEFTTVELKLTDTQGLPIEQAQVISRARMTNMEMVTDQNNVRYLGQGVYAAQLHLYMTGPWAITIQVYADGFDTLPQTLQVNVA
ncbi:MAG TPA: FixH family protein [Ktedonobacteraceae bacterium]|nr:FixH family protein [Ktedonobacteraceae bacterium]